MLIPNQARIGVNRREFGAALAMAGVVSFLPGCTDEPIDAEQGGGGMFVYRHMPPLIADGWINGNANEELLRGRVQVVDCFASWCGPCALAAPAMVQLYLKYRYNGVRFWGMTSEGEAKLDAVIQFVERHHTDWPIAYGAGPTMQLLEVETIPRVFVVGKDNMISWDSQQSSGSLERAIRNALAQPSPAQEKTDKPA